jgi:predicted RNase H-like HicB family nuclease
MNRIPKPEEFHFNVTWHSGEKIYLARCVEIPACTGQGNTVVKAGLDVLQAVEDHLLYRAEIGLEMPVPEE